MKYFLLCLILLFVACAPVKKEQAEKPTYTFIQQHGYTWEDQTINDMTYRIYIKGQWSSQTGYSIHVVNLTKDQLEVALLRKQLQEKSE